MASIVTEILSSAGQLQREELSDKISGLNGRISDLKIQLQDSLHSRYDQFHPIFVKTTELASKLATYSSEVENLTSLVENELVPKVQESSEEFREVRRQLATSTQTLQVVNRLIEVHDVLEASETSFVNDHFKEAVDSLDRVATMTDDLVTSWGCRVQVLNGLKREHTVRKEKLTHDLGEIWNNCVTFETIAGESARLSIHRSGGGRKISLSDLVQAMDRLGYLISKLKVFGNRFHKQIFIPIVTQSTEVNVSKKGETVVLTVTLGRAIRDNPKDVFAKLTNILDFLDASFGNIQLASDSEHSEPISLLRFLGSIVCKELYDLLIKECLLPAMPTRRKDLSGYTEVIETVKLFHKYLTNVGLVVSGDDDKGGIVSYAGNVDVIFSNKTCQEILVKSRKLMLADLYDSMIPPCSEPPSEPEIKEELELNKGLLRFPACHISKSTYELVRLLYGVMEEATSSSPLGASRLFATAKNVVELYCDIIPSYHREGLEKLPHQSALLHNNCMYIVHHLRTLGQQFQSRLSDSLGHVTITFIEFVPILEKMGSAVILEQMRNQKKQLVNMLDFTNVVSDAKSKPVAERSIKQCILQLQHLQSVWTDVLPPNVYNRAIGTLINSLVDEIIRRVIALEDLPADSATKLIAIFSVLKDKAPLLFRVPNDGKHSFEIQRHVPKWSKFQELLLILAATMVDILDRWAEGKGPLAVVFTVDEVKQMIRALFQNTDRRAAVLSKIK